MWRWSTVVWRIAEQLTPKRPAGTTMATMTMGLRTTAIITMT